MEVRVPKAFHFGTQSKYAQNAKVISRKEFRVSCHRVAPRRQHSDIDNEHGQKQIERGAMVHLRGQREALLGEFFFFFLLKPFSGR